MADETVKPAGEMPEQPAQAAGTVGTQVPVTTPTAAEEPFDKERAMKTILSLREQEKQWKKEIKELEALRAEKQAKTEAEMTEVERLKKKADEIQAQNAQLQLDILKRDVIAETGLPAVFAERLKGTTKEEMLADAQELLKVLPQSQPKPAPHLNSTNPSGAQTTETDAQKRERLFGRQTNAFDINAIREGGGGVVWHKPPEK